jgi:hypothetical protein
VGKCCRIVQKTTKPVLKMGKMDSGSKTTRLATPPTAPNRLETRLTLCLIKIWHKGGGQAEIVAWRAF